MITNKTRFESYKQTKKTAKNRRDEILETLGDREMTAREILEEIRKKKPKEIAIKMEMNYVRPRLTDLVKIYRQVVVCGEKKDFETNKMVAIFRKAESKSRTCENCEWSCNQAESEFLKCLIDSEEKGLCECCDRFKPKTGNHVSRID